MIMGWLFFCKRKLSVEYRGKISFVETIVLNRKYDY